MKIVSREVVRSLEAFSSDIERRLGAQDPSAGVQALVEVSEGLIKAIVETFA